MTNDGDELLSEKNNISNAPFDCFDASLPSSLSPATSSPSLTRPARWSRRCRSFSADNTCHSLATLCYGSALVTFSKRESGSALLPFQRLPGSDTNQGRRRYVEGFSQYLILIALLAVRTKVDDDTKYLPAKSVTISVRCYETRVGRVGTLHSNILVDYTQVLWSKPDDQEWAEIGDLDFPFRITLPTNVAGYSKTTFQEYRVFWRVEAGASICVSHFFRV